MTIKASKIYFLQYEKLLKKQLLTEEQYQDFIAKCKQSNLRDTTLRPHKIECIDGKTILSLSVPNTQLRVLAAIVCKPKIAIFFWFGKHREYEIIIRNKKNCIKYFKDCDEEDVICI